MDETYVAVKGQWAYLYRAIDNGGHLVDTMLSEHRDFAAAKAFFESARAVVGFKPKQVFTDGHIPYPRAIEETLGKRVEHHVIPCLGNPVEQAIAASSSDTIQRWGSRRWKRPQCSVGCMTRRGAIFGHGRRWGKK